jgi:hypothetical protein
VVKVNRTDLDQVVDDYDAIPNIGLDNPEECGPFHAQELAQGPCSCREQLGPVAQDPDLADDIARPGRANQLQITHIKIIRRITQAFGSTNEPTQPLNECAMEPTEHGERTCLLCTALQLYQLLPMHHLHMSLSFSCFLTDH